MASAHISAAFVKLTLLASLGGILLPQHGMSSQGGKAQSSLIKQLLNICRYVPRGGFLTDPHEVEQKVPLGGKPAPSRAGGGRGPAKAAVDPVLAPRHAAPRKAAKTVVARGGSHQAAAGRPKPAVARAKATQRTLDVLVPGTRFDHVSKPLAGQRPARAAGLTTSEQDASRCLAPHLRATVQGSGGSLTDSHGLVARELRSQHPTDPMRGSQSASFLTDDHQDSQPTSPGAGDPRAAGKEHAGTVPLSPPGVVGNRLGLVGEAWPISSAGSSSVGEEGPQVPMMHPSLCEL